MKRKVFSSMSILAMSAFASWVSLRSTGASESASFCSRSG
jgi:hypothetical protein